MPKAQLTRRQTVDAITRLSPRFETARIERKLRKRIRRRYEPRWWKYLNGAAALVTIWLMTNMPAWSMWK